MSREFFEATVAWWHRVTLARVRYDQAEPPADYADPAASSACLPVGAFTGEGEFDAEERVDFDPHPPDC